MSHLKQICTFSLLLLSFLIGSDGIAQLAIGQWRDHLSYKKGISITQSADNIYCATESGMFTLKKSDNSIERLSKITGLSDVEVNTIRYNDYNNTLLIAYKNANIDLITGSTIFNISDIKRSIITAKKTIHNIHYRNQLAYLACGFGIVVLDMNKKEIKETYYIGVNGGYLNVRDITSDANYLYAATDSGVYYASFAAPNLADFKSWIKFTGLPQGVYNTIASFAGKIYTNYSAPPSAPWPSDIIYEFNGTQWIHFSLSPDTVFNPVRKIEESQNKLMISQVNYVGVYDADSLLGSIYLFNTQFDIDPYQCITDANNPYTYWVADNYNGLTKCYNFNGGSESYAPNGPNTSNVYTMNMAGEELWVAPGDRGETWSNVYNKAEAYRFSDEAWSSITKKEIPALDSIYDVVSIAVDPTDKDHFYLGTLGPGLVEIDNGALVQLWNETNSSLQSTGWSSTYHWLGIFGLNFDKDGNLWVSNSTAPQPLSVRQTDGTWQSFNFSALATNPTSGSILIDQSGQKWLILPRNVGVIVFDETETWATGDDKMKKLSSAKGSGSLPSNEVICLAEDHDGEIWAGTDKGIAVFYCADQALSASGCEAQQVFIEQDGHTQILLETEVVNAIAIDGANRKWIGTQNSGAYLMSEDGTAQIKHFTIDNSPLLSNEIRSIAIHPKTGEVFFGTGRGIISYRNDATEGLEDYTDVYVFPNPVKPGYAGPIAITGLVENADVKITDVSGSLVYQTKALGGQAIWYGKNFKGESSRSGVYLVFCSNDDGSKTFITKILLVN
ncbi:MAG: T9SS type A sorting domain-containing protein [Bacteroidetes bacterium]|nr:MAG: T9SS type A sorting domain-containing protein [Bacteroidota bacterium]